MQAEPMLTYTQSGQAYTRRGSGPALILLHGWPFHSATFRSLLPLLSAEHTCYTLDAAGMGFSAPAPNGDYSFEAHAQRVGEFADELGLSRFALLGHDTGGTVARLVAVNRPAQVEKLILMDTEMPGHIPPVVPRYQRLLRFGIMRQVFTWMLRSKAFGRSRHGFRGCFHDPAKLSDEFLALFSSFWVREPKRLEGLINYLMGIDHAVIDQLHDTHTKIRAPTLTIWGEHDKIFPLVLAKNMADQMPSCQAFKVIANAGFLVHEEQPRQVAEHVLEFLGTGVAQTMPARA